MSRPNLHRILVLLLVLLPLFTILYLSLVTQWSYPQLLKADYTLRYWRDLLADRDGLPGSLLLSLFIATFQGSMATTFAFPVSRQLMEQPRLRRLLKLAYYPYLIAPVVLGTMLQVYFIQLGLNGALAGVLLAQALFIIPFSVLLLSTFWNERTRQIAFQASSLGAGNWQLYRTVLLPMAQPWLLLSFTLCFLVSWFEYGITQLIGVGKVETLTIRVMQYVQEANPHQAALAACLMIVPVVALLLVLLRIFIKRGIRT